jgi:5-methylcytosine-specific restriction endonuclease McrA
MPETKYGDKKCKDKVWNLAKTINGKDSNMYRKDPAGTQIYYSLYGKNGKQSWEIDHIKPIKKGGSDCLRNLQALNSHINKSKGDSLQKPSRHSKSNK